MWCPDEMVHVLNVTTLLQAQYSICPPMQQWLKSLAIWSPFESLEQHCQLQKD
jgi:hypothetical protein